MRVCVLASGSKGNALVVEGGGTRVLVDCGLTPKVLRARLNAVGLELTDLDALLITHAHGDHCAGALRLSGAMRLKCYATRGTQRQLSRRGGLPNFHAVEPGGPFAVGELTVTGVALPHDAPGTVAYVLDHGGERFAVCTDLGFPDPAVARALGGCDTLHLEFNHDEDMLWGGPYPQRLKHRVASDKGHLSNRQAAELLAAIDTSRLRRLLLSHLSEVNNTPSLALEAAKGALAGSGIKLMTAPQYEPTRWLEVAEDTGRELAPPAQTASAAFDTAAQACVAASEALSSRLVATRVAPKAAPVTERIVRTLRGEATRPAPRPAVRSLAVKRQLSLFGD